MTEHAMQHSRARWRHRDPGVRDRERSHSFTNQACVGLPVA